MKFTITIPGKLVDHMVKDVFMSIDIERSINYWCSRVDTRNNKSYPLRYVEIEEYTTGAGKRFTITESFAKRCIKELYLASGIIGVENYDSTDLDNAVQMVVFGKIIYG